MKNRAEQLNELRMSRKESFKTSEQKYKLKQLKKKKPEGSLIKDFFACHAPKFGGFKFNGVRISLI